MNEKLEGARGEYRELTAKQIGDFVRFQRHARGIKRLSLAQEIGVSEKSLERLEGGVRVSEEVYRKVARALGHREDAFLGPRYISTPQKALQLTVNTVRQWNDKYLEIEVHQCLDERDMRRVLACWGALFFDDSQLKADALDAAACFKQDLSDWIDVFEDIDEPGKLMAQRTLIDELREVERYGYEARFGSYDAEFSAGAKWVKMPTAVVTFVARNDWKRLAMKKMAVARRFNDWAF
jgi:transcriptional regulator with XRE-family HTH domain